MGIVFDWDKSNIANPNLPLLSNKRRPTKSTRLLNNIKSVIAMQFQNAFQGTLLCQGYAVACCIQGPIVL